MKLLLIVGCASDIFISSMAKWLKHSMEVEIDVFEFDNNRKQDVSFDYYNHVESSAAQYPLAIFGLRTWYTPFLQSCSLKKFLKGKQYDIIHVHWIVPPIVLSTKAITNHCKSVFITFWGREYDLMHICGTNMIYKLFLKSFLKKVTYDVNSASFKNRICPIYPFMESKMRVANLGSSSLDYMDTLLKNSSKEDCKFNFEMPVGKYVVQIGYSGKALHQHLEVIEELIQHQELSDNVHLFAPMTRGADSRYVDQVDAALKKSGFSYTLLRDRFLADEEIAQIRYATDITLQLSSTDAFSRSIVEAFCGKSIVIYGKWLNYKDHLEDNGFVAIPTETIEGGIKKLADVIRNPQKYATTIENNSTIGMRKYHWDECIKDWISAYNEVL